jgi:hypothetical protein
MMESKKAIFIEKNGLVESFFVFFISQKAYRICLPVCIFSHFDRLPDVHQRTGSRCLLGLAL